MYKRSIIAGHWYLKNHNQIQSWNQDVLNHNRQLPLK